MGNRRPALAPIPSTAVLLACLGCSISSWAAPTPRDSDCLDCHADQTLVITNAAGQAHSLFVDRAKLASSVHHTNTCVSCHADVTARHPDDNRAVETVRCVRCHERQAASYGASVHGQAQRSGRVAAATCQDCHDSHEILAPASPASPLHFSRQAATCGACHDQEAKDLAASVHGKAAAAGQKDAPTCTDCHSEHRIEALKSRSPLAISQQVCSKCHASERLNTKYNLPADRVKTFFESYHGLAAQYGSTLAANCASCHGFHKILPSSDPASTIHPDHLVETCGRCHPGANEKFASGRIHVDLDSAASGPDAASRINWWVRRIYLALIVGVIGTMLVHNLLLFWRKTAQRYRQAARPVLRMSLAQRGQHILLAAGFIVLAFTGFALKFPDSWLARALGSNEPFRRWSHRVAGLLLLAVGAVHVIYLFSSPEGRVLLKDFFPIKKDLLDIWESVRYLAGRRPEKPRIGRFGYAEKMEYWAVVWGTIIMGVTGLAIWFKIDVTHFMPRWVVDVAVTIHYYEAILACLAIVVWHFYHVMFDPDVYPLNPACWDGKVSEHWMHEEHPLDASVSGVPEPRPSPRSTASPSAPE